MKPLVGLVGGVQPSSATGAWRGLGVLMLVDYRRGGSRAAGWCARWRVWSNQVDAIGRGEVPTARVRGTREIERLGYALTTMARQRAAPTSSGAQMLIGVSHDLRSPLARIRVAADLLDQQAPLRDPIVRNVDHADAIIDSFSRTCEPTRRASRDDVDLSGVANSAAR